jgi:hypothetical protein
VVRGIEVRTCRHYDSRQGKINIMFRFDVKESIFKIFFFQYIDRSEKTWHMYIFKLTSKF